MASNNPDMPDLSRARGMSVTEHLRNSIYKHLFCEQCADNFQSVSWDANTVDQNGSEE
jgi:hypothetical protein